MHRQKKGSARRILNSNCVTRRGNNSRYHNSNNNSCCHNNNNDNSCYHMRFKSDTKIFSIGQKQSNLGSNCKRVSGLFYLRFLFLLFSFSSASAAVYC